jgi:hypothetical protein
VFDVSFPQNWRRNYLLNDSSISTLSNLATLHSQKRASLKMICIDLIINHHSTDTSSGNFCQFASIVLGVERQKIDTICTDFLKPLTS